MKNSNEEMGKRLGYLRDVKFGKAHGSKTQCSQELGISTGYWGDIERGRKKIGIDLIQKLAEFFQTDCEWLITGKSYDVRFLAEYYTEKYRENNSWYETLVLLIDLAVKWRDKKNNKFFQAAATTLKCAEDTALWEELEGVFSGSRINDEMVNTLAEVDGGKSARSKVGRMVRDIINDIEADLLEVNVADMLPSVIPGKGKKLDSGAKVKLLENKVMELETQISDLKKQLRSEKSKVSRLKKKMA